MGEDFIGFLANLAQVFPSLAKRPLYLTGEVSTDVNDPLLILIAFGRVMPVCWSCSTPSPAHQKAGTYIPYITKTYFNTPNPPVHLVKIAIGGAFLVSVYRGSIDTLSDGAIGSEPVFEDTPVVCSRIRPQR
jgi:carboxypeptidase D